MEYNFREIEKKWHQKWVENKTYKVVEDENKKKFYVLNMFPYPSGAGLHVGHLLGGGLAHTAGHAHHLGVVLAAVVCAHHHHGVVAVRAKDGLFFL